MESLQSKSNSGPDTEPSKTAENGASGRARLREWLRAKQNHQQLQIGVSFRNLECIGRCVSAQPQATYISALARLLRASRSQEEVRILSDFEGLIRPGEMLLVLGRPGSGCSTFLKALSGETHGFDLGENSIINYQGMRYKTFHRNFFGQRNYLAELDVHFPELTLGQTLEFASSARANNCQNSKSHCEKSGEGTARIMASVFGLTSAYDTLMGDVLIRGVSGGEKRRTSIAEAYISGSQLQCWDNSTRGLDSLTAKRFIEVLRQSTDALQSTVAMSLYQASESMYMNFDKVILLYEGHEIFFGPINTAVHYFTNLGFARPRNATTPDFLTSLTNPPEHVAQEGWRNRLPRSRDDFVAAWKSSNQAKSLRDEILTFESMHPFSSTGSIPTIGEQTPGSNVLSPQSPTFSLQIHGQIIVCLKRAFHRLRNNFTPVLSTIIANAILGIVIGSAFYDLGEDSLSLMQRSTLLFFVTMLNSFVPAFEIDIMWAQRPIVEKHHRYAFYHPFAERVAFMISDFPAKVALSFMLHLPVYFMANLRRTSKGFFVYWFFMLVNLFTMAMLFRMIGAISKSRDGTMTPVSILTLLCVLYTGFVVPPPYMVPWLGWFRYINPIAYTYESLMVNELHHRQFPCSTIIPDGPAYVNITKADRLCAEVGRHTGTDMVDGTDFLALKYGYTEGHLWRNMAILLSMMVAFFIVHLLASEYISAQKSRGEVLIFNKPIAKHREDEEAAMAENTARPHDSALGEKTDNHERHGHLDPMNTIHARYQSSIFHWNDLAYSVKIHGESRKLLADISGWLKPGSLTALMGATGAGKTTLLDVLAGRALSGEVSGDIFIDGRPRDDTSSFRRRMAYVQQNDIHLPTATVREALQFSALLRQSNARSKAEKLDYVEDVLKMLDMEAYADAVVGVPGEGLNVEQRKRLSIGVEMAAMPDLVLFLGK
ncbi:Multidrug resistance protein [Conoideocrella luteorostrata]|uniref:Multidrug resistance protein n=1 Tax=Conoideocrella luteorostrata TaxID=1105319 RepID=A0AAJ0FPA3_9HYPO|nr:Multidrug resistance protein [Conoideocrella luteorostrata]